MLKGMEKVGKQAAKLQADVLEKTVEGTPIQAPLKAVRAELESVLSAVEGTRPEMESRLSDTLSKSIDTSTAAAQQVKSFADNASQQANDVAQQATGAAQMAAQTAQSTAQEALNKFGSVAPPGIADLATNATAQAAAIFENFQKMAMSGPIAASMGSPSAASAVVEDDEEFDAADAEESEGDAVLREEMAKWEAEMAKNAAAAAPVAAAPAEVELESTGDPETDRILAEEMAKFNAAADEAAVKYNDAAAPSPILGDPPKREFSTWASPSSSPNGGAASTSMNRFVLAGRYYGAFAPTKYSVVSGIVLRQLFQGGRGGVGVASAGGGTPLQKSITFNVVASAAYPDEAAHPAPRFSSDTTTTTNNSEDDSQPTRKASTTTTTTTSTSARVGPKLPPKASELKLKKPRPKLSDVSQEKRVPTGRVERLASYTGLAAGLALGGLAEMTKRAVGGGETSLTDSSVLLNPANAERIVSTLCRVRGAALKMGQMLSIADNSLISPELQKIFDRVRQGADFMPWSQTEGALTTQLGHDWRDKVAHFDQKPFAAASIGQVHMAELHNGQQVAVKIQYPGVAEGIDSDINNLVSILNATRLVPDALFLDELVRVARKELAWEVDYVREKEASNHFRELLANDPIFYVPEVNEDLSSMRVLTTEFLEGVPLDAVSELECLETRNLIGESILRLTLTELFDWRCMQTDPNWSNFLFWTEKSKIGLLDFGASRYFTTKFVDDYVKIINSAALGDKDGILHWSKEVGFITGYEAKALLDAHVDAIMILGEAFQKDAPFDFGNATTLNRVTNIIPAILTHRLAAPPEEVYSLHRKMAGVFLLCTRLKCNMNIKHLWDEIWGRYEFGRPDLPEALAQNSKADVKSVSGKR